MTPVHADAVRALVARSILGATSSASLSDGKTPADTMLGSVTLRPHQLEAIGRLRVVLAELGGALLADATGLGKTYVAIALARDAARPLVVAPAGLREMWRLALDATRVVAPVVSIESLSRGGAPGADPDLVIVDEAHHVRNPATRRHRALAELCAASRVLLLTATPVHNRTGDLEALLALFLGERAHRLGGAELARCIVRRTAVVAASLPRVLTPEPLDPGGSDAPAAALLALPPPVPASGAGDGGALVLLGLVRQWASSEGALRAALRRRLVTGTALLGAVESGRRPTRADLRRWVTGDDTIQLELPYLLDDAPREGESAEDVPAHGPAGERAEDADARTRAAIEAHLAGLRLALHTLDAHGGCDERRIAALLALRARHPGERIVAFTQFADTVHALFRGLRASPRVAALTADGAQVAGGRLTRAEAVGRFAPRAHGRAEPPAAERIELLVTTDLLSEGVNLQDASVAVHLDLPWTPARLEQRIGRLARLGATHDRVAVYAMRPPAAAAMLLDMERRLRRKLGAAARVAGIAGTIVPALLDPLGTLAALDAAGSPGIPAATETTLATLRRWLALPASGPRPPEAAIAACRSRREGWLALVGDEGAPRLVAALDGGPPSSEPTLVADAVTLADGAPDLDAREIGATQAIARALRGVTASLESAAASSAVDLGRVAASRARREVVRRIAGITTSAPLHRRGSLAPLVARARAVATSPCGLGAERILAELAASPMADEAWLRALAAFGELHARSSASGEADGAGLRALLVLVPG